jgi:predicted ATPase
VIVRPVLCRPFVGRLNELAYLHERRREAGASRGGLVFISGDACLGKSRLIAEFCRSLTYSRWRIAYGPCREFAGRPYGPVLDALASLDPSASRWAPAESKREQFDAIAERFAAIASKKALVVVIDDLHWADAATLDLLVHLSSSMPRMRALFLVSFRPGDVQPGDPATAAISKMTRQAQAGRIDLAPLQGLQLRTFIDEALVGIDLSQETRRAIALVGEGNPFFTEELLKNAVQQAPQPRRFGHRPQIPQTIRTTLLERLRPFDARERRIVTHAAAIGRTFNLDLLSTITGAQTESVVTALRRARDVQLIEELEPNAFRFRHALTREVICSEFLETELRPLHHNIAQALESRSEDDRPIEALAYHWWAAGDQALSTQYNDLAGDAARQMYAHEDAVAFYERALESQSIDPVARGAILEKIANLRLVLSMAEEGAATTPRRPRSLRRQAPTSARRPAAFVRQ